MAEVFDVGSSYEDRKQLAIKVKLLLYSIERFSFEWVNLGKNLKNKLHPMDDEGGFYLSQIKENTWEQNQILVEEGEWKISQWPNKYLVEE